MIEARDAGSVLRAAARTYGAKGLVRRSLYEARCRTGAATLSERATGVGTPWPGFTVEARVDHKAVAAWAGERADEQDLADAAVARGERLLAGWYALYGGEEYRLGWPPAWHADVTTGTRRSSDRHWSRLSDDGSGGDVKDIWEPSRLSWIATLARAYAYTGEARWADAFWDGVLDWCAENAPYLGANWMSGQEVALRGIALLFGLGVFGADASSSPERLAVVGGLLRDSVRRVAATLGYAQSQRNNHAVSEAAFLWSMAALNPSLSTTGRLRRRAERALTESAVDQFGLDGSYAQHSFTYQRLALHALLWVQWVGEQTGCRVPGGVEDAVSTSLGLLRRVLDENSGRVPNLGSNDGAVLFRLSETPIGDFRPLIAHAAAAVGIDASLPAGVWDEEAVWFGHRSDTTPARAVPPPPTADSAYHVLRGPDCHALFHAGPLRHRPSHADQLNLDLWIGGVNVVRDPGTYRYSAPAPWHNSLAAADVHNVSTLADAATARRLGRFFWLDWPEASVVLRRSGDDSDVVIADLVPPGSPDALLRRLVCRRDRVFVVCDLVAPGPGTVRWNLPPGTVVEQHGAVGTVTGNEFRAMFLGGTTGWRVPVPTDSDPASGWESTTYGERSPIVSLVLPVDAEGLAAAVFTPLDVDPPGDDVIAGWRDATRSASEQAVVRALQRWSVSAREAG